MVVVIVCTESCQRIAELSSHKVVFVAWRGSSIQRFYEGRIRNVEFIRADANYGALIMLILLPAETKAAQSPTRAGW